MDSVLRRRLADGAVMVTVAAALTAILLPMFRALPGSADDDLCLSHLRTLGTAIRVYENDYDEQLVPYTLLSSSGSKRWTQLVIPYVADTAAYHCPLDHLVVQPGMPYMTTYGINWYISASAGTWNGTTIPGRPYSFVKSPAETIQLADSAVVAKTTASLPPVQWLEDLQKAPTTDIYYFYLPRNAVTGEPDTTWSTGSGFTGTIIRPFPRHNGFVNVGFYDGHVAPVPASQFDPSVTHFGDASCLWDNVAPVYTMADAAHALRAAAGIDSLSATDCAWLDVIYNPAEASTVDTQDAVLIARKAAGLSPNP